MSELLAFLRARRSAAPIVYGRVRYEGVLYVIIKHLQPITEIEELCRRSADHSGRSRYGTQGRPTWYGALDPLTAIAEASYHAMTDEGGNEGADVLGALYQLRVRGRFVDLHGRERTQPEIVGDDYAPTQLLARQVRTMTPLSGVLYPSARSSGTCLAMFTQQAMRNVKFIDTIPMRRISQTAIKVRAPRSTKWWKLRLDDLRRTAAAAARVECA